MSTTLQDDGIWPVDQLETGTVGVYVYADGEVQVIADQDPDRADWSAVCDRLAELGAPPLGPCDYDGELDVWSVRLPAAA